jgi:phosphoglucosamine mutase
MMTGKLFGTDGIRGRANTEPITAETALKIGKAVVGSLQGKGDRGAILIARDTRLSGQMLSNAVVAGIVSMGAEALDGGILPTPACAFLTRSMKLTAGIMVSASHNPPWDNGFKFFDREGYKFSEPLESQMEKLIAVGGAAEGPTGSRVGGLKRLNGSLERYVTYAKGVLPRSLDLKDMKIALDCSNGAAYNAGPMIFGELGAEISLLACEPDGAGINHDCGALHISGLIYEVKSARANIGIAFDGDADRVTFVDETGSEVDSDRIMGIIALDMISKSELKRNTMAVTVVGNAGLDITMKAVGGSVIRTPVGDRHVLAKMRELGLNFGGESSGHIIVGNYATCGDGLVTAVRVLQIMVESGKPLSELAKQVTCFPQILKNVPIKRKQNFDQIPEVREAIQQAQAMLKNRGRLLVRYSGTQPVCRVLAEGEDLDKLRQAVDIVSEAIEHAQE